MRLKLANPPIFYLWIYRKIRLTSNGRFYIPYGDILSILKRSIPWTPHILYHPIISDMTKFKLLKRIDKTKYEIIGGKADIFLNKYNLI